MLEITRKSADIGHCDDDEIPESASSPVAARSGTDSATKSGTFVVDRT
jgi:hypothetical protein